MAYASLVPERAVLAVGGDEARGFLQGLLSNDVLKLDAHKAGWAALLTAQGKFLHECLITLDQDDARLLLLAETARRDDLLKRLKVYRLRSKVTLEPLPDLGVAVAWGAGVGALLDLPDIPGAARRIDDGLRAFVDPRQAELGVWLVGPAADLPGRLVDLGLTLAPLSDWHRLRITAGVPDGAVDLPVDKALLLENGFDELRGIDWKKGCYVGQELTARTKYRALVKKRLLPVRIDGPVPAPGTPILFDGADAGEMRGAVDGLGLALLRLEMVEKAAGAPLQAGEARLTLQLPSWLALPG